MTTTVVELDADHVDALARFFADLPAGDLTFVKEDVGGPAAIRGWMRPGRQWLALDDGEVAGFVAVLPLHGWSDHVGEIRLVVHPRHRGAGLGRTLARHALLRALEQGLRKVVVEVVADQEALLGMFSGLGFTGEALLTDHVRDREGRLHDLVLLAHHVETTSAAMRAIGLEDEVAPG
ncbi:N-acetyltransferase family protein [Actinomycetospora sp. CA-101289]|uniref:GNAT family N-acetyltransferase n=1 Tax=Actinomycetospora sp. CA-101289 TaxID=3239893 RepID=UPI003D987F26